MNNIPTNIKTMKRMIKTDILDYTALFSPIATVSGDEIVEFDLKTQLSMLLKLHKKTILAYREELLGGNGDILCFSKTINDKTILNLHLLISIDGANPYHKKKCSFWPIQAILLDLPNYLRCKWQNTLLLLMCKCTENSKPNWKNVLKTYLDCLQLGKPILLDIGNEMINICLHLHAGIFDLPAQASVLNVIQFNGAFGCLYCKHPGIQTKSGSGTCRIYPPFEFQMLSDTEYKYLASAAESTHTPVYGIKGESVLNGYVNIPSNILIDSMHMLYENITKKLLLSFFDSQYHSKPFYVKITQYNST